MEQLSTELKAKVVKYFVRHIISCVNAIEVGEMIKHNEERAKCLIRFTDNGIGIYHYDCYVNNKLVATGIDVAGHPTEVRQAKIREALKGDAK